jgi:hypothetical protein
MAELFSFANPVTHERGLFNPYGDIDAANESLARDVARRLGEFYPNHPWGVMAEIEHGIVKIALQGFTQWPYVIHVDTLKADPGMRSVFAAGGEILEKFRMPRQGFSLADWRAANARMPYHFYRTKKPPE